MNRWWPSPFWPNRQRDAEWIAAAARKAHQLGINPGGQMLAIDITDRWAAEFVRFYTKDHLYRTKAELEDIDARIELARADAKIVG